MFVSKNIIIHAEFYITLIKIYNHMKISLLKSTIALTGIMFVTSCTNSGEKEKVQVLNSELKQKQLNYKMLEHENIGRGVVTIPLETGKKVFSGEGTFEADKRKVYVGWRLLASDPDQVKFNIYRHTENGIVTKLNDSPISNSTNFVDPNLPDGEKFAYTIKKVIDGIEENASPSCSIICNAQSKPYQSIKLNGDHAIEKIAIADLDGDGEMDFVTKCPRGNVDPWYLYWRPSKETYKLQAYKSSGKYLWTYDMGWAIEQGTWYSPYLVYDFNGDGKAEIVVKSGESDPRNEEGKVLTGPEYVAILDGMTGMPIAQAEWIPREPFFEVNTEHAYNYASRNQIAVAYLDGVHPHIIVLRGTYNLMIARAYRLIDNDLKLIWEWDNRNLRDKSNNYWGQGGHTTIAADVDNDGCDELILGSCVLDHDGTPLWTTGLGHCDGMFVGDILPERPGLEIYYNIEAGCPNGNGMCIVDSKTGEVIWGSQFPTYHVHGAGFCSDIDRTQPGRECYGVEIAPFEGKGSNFAVMYNSKGEIFDRNFLTTWSVFWDTDNQRELLSEGKIYDYKGPTIHNNEIEGNIIAVADILGDWREEIITSVPGEIRIYSTTILNNSRHNCLLQDPIYRSYVAHASNGYYELPMTTYDIPFRSSR
jgi:rhamnogalacturonan endolyase